MHIDFKISTWERVEIPSELEQEVLEAIKTGKITSTSDLVDKYSLDWDKMEETDEQLIPADNDGQSTIEVFQNKGDSKAIWMNGNENNLNNSFKPLYFIIEKQLQDVGDVQETNGLKNIFVYEINNNIPKLIHSIEVSMEDNSEASIQEYLDDNGYGDTYFKFIAL